MTLKSEKDNFKFAALIGSTSPIKSGTVTSGVASFSVNLSDLCIQDIGVLSASFLIKFLA